jgi:hypothetical protein
MNTDPAIQRTRDARKRISASAGNDPAKLIEYYMWAGVRGRTKANSWNLIEKAPESPHPRVHGSQF